MASGDPLALLIPALIGMRVVTSFSVAAATIFIWDYLLTFRMEVELVWKSRWNFMKGLFLFQRYLPFVDTVWFVLRYQTGGGLSKTTCWTIYHFSGAASLVGLAASEMILALRTWAVWNRDPRLTIILPILYVLLWGSSLALLVLLLNSMEFSDPPYPGFTPCFMTDANSRYLVFVWALEMVWDTLVLILMLIPGFRAFRTGGNGALMKVVYRDGVIYFIFIFVLSLINIIAIETFPPQYQNVMASMDRVLRSMFTSRVLLNIRARMGVTIPVWKEGLTELSTLHLGDNESKFNGRAEITVSTTEVVSLS